MKFQPGTDIFLIRRTMEERHKVGRLNYEEEMRENEEGAAR
jgi:hypothetical protein